MQSIDSFSLMCVISRINVEDLKSLRRTCSHLRTLINSDVFLRSICYTNLCHCAANNDMEAFEFMICNGQYDSREIKDAIIQSRRCDFATLSGHNVCERMRNEVTNAVKSHIAEFSMMAAYFGDIELLKTMHCKSVVECKKSTMNSLRPGDSFDLSDIVEEWGYFDREKAFGVLFKIAYDSDVPFVDHFWRLSLDDVTPLVIAAIIGGHECIIEYIYHHAKAALMDDHVSSAVIRVQFVCRRQNRKYESHPCYNIFRSILSGTYNDRPAHRPISEWDCYECCGEMSYSHRYRDYDDDDERPMRYRGDA